MVSIGWLANASMRSDDAETIPTCHRDKNFERNERRHSRPAQQNQPQAVEHDPDEEENGHARGADLGYDHEDHRTCVQQQRQAESGQPFSWRRR